MTPRPIAPSATALAAVALLALLGPADARAQAWAPDRGEGTISLGVRVLRAQKYFDRGGEVEPIGAEYRQITVPLWAHVGVVPRHLAISVAGELVRFSEVEESGNNSGRGDLELGAWTGIVEGRVVLSAGVVLGLPTGDPGTRRSDPSDPEPWVLPTGDGEFDVRPTLAFGASLTPGHWPVSSYTTASIGYWVHGGSIGNSVRWSAELGVSPTVGEVASHFGLALRFDGVVLIDDDGEETTFTGLGDGVAWSSWGVGVPIRLVEGAWIEAGYSSAFSAQNVPAAAVWSGKVGWDF